MHYDFNPNTPIYLQIMELIKKDIIAGGRGPGDRMDSVRELAQNFGVNPNTMQRALSDLEREGFLFSERTAGRFITKDVELIRNTREEIAKVEMEQFIKQMKALGYSLKEIIVMVEAKGKEIGETYGH